MRSVLTVLLTFGNAHLKMYDIYYVLKIETQFYTSKLSINICDTF